MVYEDLPSAYKFLVINAIREEGIVASRIPKAIEEAKGVLDCLFVWDNTKEGINFWIRVARATSLKVLPPITHKPNNYRTLLEYITYELLRSSKGI